MNFSTCAHVQIFYFRDGHVTTFQQHSGVYITQISESRLSIGTIGLGETVSCKLCSGYRKRTLKTRK